MENKGFMSDIVKDKKLKSSDVQEILKKIKDSSQGNEIFEKMQQEKTTSLKDSIEDIQRLIGQREKLSKELLADMDQIKFEVGNIITKVATELGGVESQKEQIMLKQKQVEIEEVKVQEKLNCWRDIADLKKELREREQELKEKETRLGMIDDLIGG
ncbi:MAG: hypothetical protein ISS23_00390 [Nanoarchaeota archaeon]|nr:hypothetical protein [Nanoarchaeota archaeon]